MKAVSKSYFKQDPKVRENLEREIRIMKLLKNCEFVVRLNHVQVSPQRLTGSYTDPSLLYMYTAACVCPSVYLMCLFVQDMKQHIVLVMELCEYDLDYLVKQSPFREDDITLFLFQLGNFRNCDYSSVLTNAHPYLCRARYEGSARTEYCPS